MAKTTKQQIAELQAEVGKLAEAHNTLVASHNRAAATLERLGLSLAGGLTQLSLCVRSLEATTMDTLVNKQIVSLEDWMKASEEIYKQLAATEQVIEEEPSAIINEEPAPETSSIIL